MSDPARIICVRTEDLAFGDGPFVPSVARRCEECDRQVWVDKLNVPKIKEHGLIVTCVPCFQALLGRAMLDEMIEEYGRAE